MGLSDFDPYGQDFVNVGFGVVVNILLKCVGEFFGNRGVVPRFGPDYVSFMSFPSVGSQTHGRGVNRISLFVVVADRRWFEHFGLNALGESENCLLGEVMVISGDGITFFNKRCVKSFDLCDPGCFESIYDFFCNPLLDGEVVSQGLGL